MDDKMRTALAHLSTCTHDHPENIPGVGAKTWSKLENLGLVEFFVEQPSGYRMVKLSESGRNAI